ncbi:MAG: LptF/LptG family permease [Pseudomonadota bacterium]
MILALHLSRAVLFRILAVAAALGGLAMALDLVEAASDVLASDEGGLLRYLALRAPLILLAVLPISILIGPVLAFLTLSGRSEFTILRAAGVTTYRMLVSLIPLALILGAALWVLSDRVAPRMEAILINWLADKPASGSGAFWARTTNGVIRAQASSPSGDILLDVDIFQTDRAGRMTARLDADIARFGEEGWRLENAVQLIPGQSESVALGSIGWNTPMTPANVRALATPGRSIAGDVAGRVLEGNWAGNRAETFYRVRIFRGYAAWLIPFVMILLAAPAAYGLRRGGGFAKGAIWAVVGGFGFLLADGMLTSLGESGNMPPILAAFGATILFAAIGGWALVTLEE